MSDAMREAFEAWVTRYLESKGISAERSARVAELLGMGDSGHNPIVLAAWQVASAQQSATIARLEAELQALIHDNDRYRESITAEYEARIAAEDDAVRMESVLRDLSLWVSGMTTWRDEPKGPYLEDIVQDARRVLAARQSAPTTTQSDGGE